MRIVVVGSGAMGRVVARDLARSHGVERVTVADMDAGRAAEVAAWAAVPGGAEVVGVGANVNEPAFAETLRGHEVCVASVAYRLNPLIAEACLQAGCGYVDLGGLFHVARITLAFDERFRQAGLTGVTCVGGSPGITDMLAVVAARRLDSARAVHVRLGSVDPSVQGLPLPIPYALDTILDEFTVPAVAYRDGGFVEVPPLGEPEDVDFPEPIGTRRAGTTLHSEIVTIPAAIPGLREVTFKIALEDALIERFQLLAAIGLASTEPLDVGGVTVRPRDVLTTLSRTLPQAAGTDDVECLRVTVEGERDGKTLTVVAESLIQPDRTWGAGGGALDTGLPPSLVAQMIGAKEIDRPGMSVPGVAIDPDVFFERLSLVGIGHTVTEIG
jgi:saccharopine dehydrogenase (NAD+, L-lysine-forming)